MKIAPKFIFLYSILLLQSLAAYTQNYYIDSIKKVLAAQRNDTNKVKLLIQVSNFYWGVSPDTSVVYAQKAFDLAEKLHFEPGIIDAELMLTNAFSTLGNYPLAVDFGFKAVALAQKKGSHLQSVLANSYMATCYYYLGEFTTSLHYERAAVKIVQEFYPDSLAFIYTELSKMFEGMKQADSALLYAKKSYQQLGEWHYRDIYTSVYAVLGNAWYANGYPDSAIFYYKAGIPAAIKNYSGTDLVDNYNGIAAIYKTSCPDSAIWYAKKVLTEKIIDHYPAARIKAANTLADLYEAKKMPDSVLKYMRIVVSLKDSLFAREKTIAIQNLAYKEQEKQKEIAAFKQQFNTRVKMYVLLAAVLALLIAAGIFLRNQRLKQLQQVRNSIADDLHDDIGSTLSSISIMSELAKVQSPEAVPLLSSIGESTLSLQENMSDIVWAINPKNDHFDHILLRMNQFASEILEAKNIELDFKNNASLPAARLTMAQRKNFYLFFKEAINNAAKHSDAKKCADAGQSANGNGMTTLKKRAAELNADFKIESHTSKGTAVYLAFKIT